MENNGWQPVGMRYQKETRTINDRKILVELWYNSKYCKWFTGEIHGNSYFNVKTFNSLEDAFKT